MWQTFRRWILIGSLSVASIGAASESAEANLDYGAPRGLDRARAPLHSTPALWAAAGWPFRVDFFHPGITHPEPVHVNEFTPTHTQQIRFVQDVFNYHK